MTELKRWLDDEAPSDLARLIRAGRVERPRSGAIERALVVVGAMTVVSSVSSLALGAQSKSVTILGSAAAKWALFSMLGLGVAATAVLLSSSGAKSARPAAVVAPAAAGPVVMRVAQETGGAREASATPLPLGSGASDNRVGGPPPLEVAPPRSLPPQRAAAEPASTPGVKSPRQLMAPAASAEESVPVVTHAASLGEEMRLIDQAREALRGGSPALCLRLLDVYHRSFAKQRLAPEAAHLRMQSALKLGDRATALAIARQIVRHYPGSPQVRRAEELLGVETNAPDSL